MTSPKSHLSTPKKHTKKGFGSHLPCWKPANCIRRVRRVEKFGVNTCSSSRHVRLMGEVLARGGKYPMFEEEPEHCGVSLLVTVELLFKARDEIRRLKANNGSDQRARTESTPQ